MAEETKVAITEHDPQELAPSKPIPQPIPMTEDELLQSLDQDEIQAGELDEYLELRKETQIKHRNPIVTVRRTFERWQKNINRWRFLQKEIRAYPEKTAIRQKKLELSLLDYRMLMTKIHFKAHKVDGKVWEMYFHILKERESLILQNNTRPPLYLRRLFRLESLDDGWHKLEQSQDRLTRLLDRAPASIEFYDRMLTLRAIRKEERAREAENSSKINAARTSLLSAISSVRELYDEERQVYSSKVLNLEDAQKFWSQAIMEIENEIHDGANTVEDVVAQFNSLENLVKNAPNLVLRIREIEERLTHIITTHDLLLANGRSIIPQKEMVRISGKLYEQVPKLWASGQRVELERTLDTMENFLSSYENSVDTELSYLERRRPGLTSAITTGGSDTTLAQVGALSRSLINAMDARDRFLRGHSEAVARLSVQIGRKMNWAQADLDYLNIAALLHDVGKISIPESILAKTTPLTDEEWRIIRMHPYFGAQIVKPIDILARIVPWIYHHQEHWNGSGYPNNLQQNEIPMASNIIAVAEAYSSMQCDMPMRQAMSKEAAYETVRNASGTQFCPEVVEVFLEIEKSS